jgi:hypothetical protein
MLFSKKRTIPLSIQPSFSSIFQPISKPRPIFWFSKGDFFLKKFKKLIAGNADEARREEHKHMERLHFFEHIKVGFMGIGYPEMPNVEMVEGFFFIMGQNMLVKDNI